VAVANSITESFPELTLEQVYEGLAYYIKLGIQELISLFAICNRLSKRSSSKPVETVRYRHF